MLVLSAVLVVTWTLGLSGCSQRSRMVLARADRANTHDLVWWHISFENDVQAPIVGIEILTSDSGTDQWILTDRGVRCYRYDGSRLTAAGPPLPTAYLAKDRDQVRRWLLYYLPAVVPNRALPPEALGASSTGAPRAQWLWTDDSMIELVELLRTHWPDSLVAPPADMTPYELAHELESFPHGVAELLAASKTLGG